jgi:triacylglycerol lipase
MHQLFHLRDRAEMLVPPLPWDRPQWQDHGGPTVVLLHGLWRGWRAMKPLARALGREGFSTLNLPYPSTRLPIGKLVNIVRQEVDKIADHRPIHFVTHSLGGILARAIMADAPSWNPGRIVMLAPPNNGSEIIDWSQRRPLIQRLLGPAGCSLGSDGFLSDLPDLTEDSEVCVIMGKRCSIPMFKHLLEEENDGIVSTSRGKLPGLRYFAVIDADHTFIQMNPEAIRLVLGFLKTGALPSNSTTG